MKKLSIIIPAYNEEKSIKELLEKVLAVDLKDLHLEKEMIVVDDGSSDTTVEKIKEIQKKHSNIVLLKHEKNIGKGAAIRTGIKESTGDIILIQDADLEYEPNEYLKLLKPFENPETNVVYGTRYKIISEEQKTNLRFKHKKGYILAYVGGRILTFLTNVLYNAKISDEATCYKVFRTKALKTIKLDCTKFEFCPEVTAKICKKGYKIKEVPISYKPRTFEEGKKINYKDGFQAIWTLIKYRIKE